jgi:hypothetical protein
MPGINKLFMVVAVILLAIPPKAQAQHELPPPEKIEVPDGGVTVPMLDVGGRPMVLVTLNGKGPYPLILDTGASVIDIDSGLVADMALPGVPGAPEGVARVEELAVGGAVLCGVVVGPAPMMAALGGSNPPRGVLGASSFPGYLVTLNYPAKTVTIRKGSLPPPDDRRIFQYAAEDILPRVPIRIGGHEFRPHVDSGSPGSLVLPVSYSSDLPLTTKPVEIGRARTVAGEFPILSADIAVPIELGEYKLDLKQIRFSDLRPGPEAPVGNIGFQVLRDFIVTMDSKNRRLKFER